MSTNYSNRSVDLLIFQGVKGPGEGLGSIELGFGTGSIVTGIAKLVQIFLIRFLTQEGSAFRNSLFGSDFMTSIREGSVYNDSIVKTVFSSAVADVKAQLSEDYDELADSGVDVPDDEKFSGAVLNSYSFQADSLTMSITISSKAGSSRTVILPIDVAIT